VLVHEVVVSHLLSPDCGLQGSGQVCWVTVKRSVGSVEASAGEMAEGSGAVASSEGEGEGVVDMAVERVVAGSKGIQGPGLGCGRHLWQCFGHFFLQKAGQ